MPTPTAFVVVEVNGAVEFRSAYALGGDDVHAAAVLELLRVARDRAATRTVSA